MSEQLNNLDEVACTCTGTTYGKIKILVEQGYDLDGISRKSGVLSGCGGCEWDVGAFINKMSLQKHQTP
jgi:bacterioferritin-associated ferredoxin